MSIPSLTDEELMVDYQNGSQEAFMQLYERYSSRIYGYLQSRIADSTKVDEIFQDVFMRLHKSRGTYNSQHAFAPWMFVVTRSAMNDFFRVSGRTSQYEVLSSQFDEGVTVTNKSTSNESFEALIHSLPQREQDVLKLRYHDDLEFEEIAKKMRLSSSNVRQIISRATRKLASVLQNKTKVGGEL